MARLTHHLAQANIARAVAPLTDPVMQGFVELLDYINAVADRAPGFVWRLQTDEGDSTAVRVYDDPRIIVNMSVWESLEALHAYVFRSDHRDPLRRRREWFQKLERPHSALWWVPAGEIPTLEEMTRRLDLLARLGPSPQAFTFARAFDPEGRPVLRSTASERGCGV